jgi:hypothetical protein
MLVLGDMDKKNAAPDKAPLSHGTKNRTTNAHWRGKPYKLEQNDRAGSMVYGGFGPMIWQHNQAAGAPAAACARAFRRR